MAYGLTLLQMVQEFCKRTALPVPATVSNSTDPAVRQYLGMLNEEIEECQEEYQWQELLRDVSFNSTAVSDQGELSAICGFKVDYILNDIMWNTATRLPIFGPVDPQRWNQYIALPITGTLLQYKIQDDHLLFYPLTPPLDSPIILTAASLFAVWDPAGAAFKQFFSLDTDLCLFKDNHMLAALRWRYKREKGLPYAEDQTRYDKIVDSRKARSGTARILNMNGDEENFGPGILVPSGSWNVRGGGIPGGAWDSTLGP